MGCGCSLIVCGCSLVVFGVLPRCGVGVLPSCGVGASHHRASLLAERGLHGAEASVAVTRGLSSCGRPALEHRLLAMAPTAGAEVQSDGQRTMIPCTMKGGQKRKERKKWCKATVKAVHLTLRNGGWAFCAHPLPHPPLTPGFQGPCLEGLGLRLQLGGIYSSVHPS